MNDAIVGRLSTLLPILVDDLEANKSIGFHTVDSPVASEFWNYKARVIVADLTILVRQHCVRWASDEVV